MKPELEIKPTSSLRKATDDKGLSTNTVMKAEVYRRLGFPIEEIAGRFHVDKKDLRAALKKYKPNEEKIQEITDRTIEGISKELTTGFTTELKAVDDIYYWSVNKLRLKVQYDNKLTAKDFKDIAEFAYKIREGSPLDDTIKAFFTQINNKQEIINMAKQDAGHEKSDSGAETSSGSETHSE